MWLSFPTQDLVAVLVVDDEEVFVEVRGAVGVA